MKGLPVVGNHIYPPFFFVQYHTVALLFIVSVIPSYRLEDTFAILFRPNTQERKSKVSCRIIRHLAEYAVAISPEIKTLARKKPCSMYEISMEPYLVEI